MYMLSEVVESSWTLAWHRWVQLESIGLNTAGEPLCIDSFLFVHFTIFTTEALIGLLTQFLLQVLVCGQLVEQVYQRGGRGGTARDGYETVSLDHRGTWRRASVSIPSKL